MRALVRPTSPRFHLAGLDIAFAEGDLLDAETVRPAMAGVRHVFHVAADYRLWARDRDEIMRNNVTSTRIVMEEALRAGVERVVYTSSVATLAVRRDGSSVDETFPLDEAKAIGVYKRSKVAAERLVERMIAAGQAAGRDRQSVDPDRAARRQADADRAHHRRCGARPHPGLRRHRPQPRPRRRLSPTAISRRSTAAGSASATSWAARTCTCRTMLAGIATLLGRRPPRIRMPRSAIVPLAVTAEAIARFTGREPLVTLDALRMSKYRMFFTTAKAERDLGLTAPPLYGRRSQMPSLGSAAPATSSLDHAVPPARIAP